MLLTSELNENAFESLLVAGEIKSYEGDMSYLAAQRGIACQKIEELGREMSLCDDLRSFRALLGVMRSFRPDIVHTHASKAGALGRVAALLVGVPVIVHTFHGHVFRGYFGSAMTSVVIAVERILARLTRAVITVSRSQAREVTETYRIAPGSMVHVIPLGLDLEGHLAANRSSGSLRASLGIKREVPLVATAGRLVEIKDLPMFLDAVKLVLARKPDVRFAIIGDGEMRPALEKKAGELGISHAVHFTGWVKDMGGVYPDVDILVQSSINEGTPVSVIEAMASGCCVVATRAGGTEDVLDGGQCGLMVPVGDSKALAEAILRAVGDADLRAELGGRAREAAKRYGIGRLVKDMEKLYINLLRT